MGITSQFSQYWETERPTHLLSTNIINCIFQMQISISKDQPSFLFFFFYSKKTIMISFFLFTNMNSIYQVTMVDSSNKSYTEIYIWMILYCIAWPTYIYIAPTKNLFLFGYCLAFTWTDHHCFHLHYFYVCFSRRWMSTDCCSSSFSSD